MNKLFLVLISFICVFTNCVADDTVYVVLFSGQSNMAGAGNYDKLTTDEKTQIAELSQRINMSENGAAPKPLTYCISKAKAEKYGFEKYFGPEFFAALTLAEAYPDQEFLFVKHSRGGTSLYGAWNPYWTEEKALAVEREGDKQTRQLYTEHTATIHKVLQDLESEGKSYKIIGEVWMQGENDAAKEVSALSYGDNLTKLIAAYRRDTKVADLPFVFGQINSRYGKFKEGPSVVRQAMFDVASLTENCTMIPTSTDTTWSDYPKHFGVHYNTEGQRRLGRAMGKALLLLQ